MGRKNDRKMVDIVIDKSGSMSGWKIKETKKKSLDELKKQLTENDRAGVIAFDTDVRELNGVGRFTPRKQRHMREEIKKISAGGNTALYDALGKSVDRLVGNVNGGDSRLKVLCLTDGRELSSKRFSNEDDVVNYANSQEIDLEMLIIGIGDDVDRKALKKIAEGTGGEYIHAPSSPEGLGNAVDRAGGMIGKKGKSKTSGENSDPKVHWERKSWPASRSEKEDDTKDDEPKPERGGIRFEGNISRDEMEYMEKVADNTVELLNRRDQMKGGTVTVPVYILKEDKFEAIFGKRTKPSRYCGRLYRHLPIEGGYRRNHHEMPAGEKGLPPDTVVGSNEGNYCEGEIIATFVNDMTFPEFEEKLRNNDAPEVTPGIYIKDMRHIGRNGTANVKCVMSYLAVSSAVYYSTSRISVVKRRKVSAMHPLMCGTVGLLSCDEETLEEIVDYSDLIGTKSLPLHLIKHAGQADARQVLSKLNDELPISDILNGRITERNEKDYVHGVEDLLDQIVNKYLQRVSP